MFGFRKRIKVPKNIDLLKCAQNCVEEYENKKREKQLSYIDALREDILKAAAQGETHITTYHAGDDFHDDWQTFALLDEIQEKFEQLGFYVKRVKPYNTYPDTWLRIYWGGDEYDESRENCDIKRVAEKQ